MKGGEIMLTAREHIEVIRNAYRDLAKDVADDLGFAMPYKEVAGEHEDTTGPGS